MKPFLTQDQNPIRAWRNYWKSPLNKWQGSLSLLLALLTGKLVVHFLIYNEQRPSVLLPDPFFQLFSPINLNLAIFLVMYGTLAFGIFQLLKKPQQLILGIQAYTVLLLLRTLCIYITPLSPPEKMILLEDPFIAAIFGPQTTITKDLLFSGHVSTAFLVFLFSEGKSRRVYAVLCLAIAAMMFLQQVHYTIDIVCAPFFTYGAFRLTLYFNRYL